MRLPDCCVRSALLCWLFVSPSAGAQSVTRDHFVPGLDETLPHSAIRELESIRVTSMCDAALRLAMAAALPLGCEAAPGPLDRSDLQPGHLGAEGWTARSVLDSLAALHQDYAWTESDGVVVVRPRDAAAEPRHFLHRVVPAVSLGQQRGLLDGLETVGSVLEGRRSRMPDDPFVGEKLFALDFPGGTLLSLLNRIVLAHGRSTWYVGHHGLRGERHSGGRETYFEFMTHENQGAGVVVRCHEGASRFEC